MFKCLNVAIWKKVRFNTFPGGGVRLDDENSDDRANSFQLKLKLD